MRQNRNLHVKPKAEMIDRIGVSLLKLLKKEYGDEYWAGRSVEEAKMAMKEINPHLENRNPREALQALKTQFKAYLTGVEPFDRKRGRNEFLRDYWCHLLDNEESDVLAVSDNQFMHTRGKTLMMIVFERCSLSKSSLQCPSPWLMSAQCQL